MSNNQLPMRELIIDKAVDLYNIHGIEYVGVRELARELGIKGGNITYYFPTKDDIIAEITTRLTQSSSVIQSQVTVDSLADLLDMHKKLYTNQYKYRSIFVSLPLLIGQNEAYMISYAHMHQNAQTRMRTQLVHLKEMGYIKILPEEDLIAIVETLTFFNRFWISEAKTDQHGKEPGEVIQYYVHKLASTLGLVATTKGKENIRGYFE